jgi:hypothetical protein
MPIPSLLQIEAECHHGALAKRIGPVSDDTLGYSLERQAPELPRENCLLSQVGINLMG